MDRSLDIAIVGVGCLFPKASGKDAYWANIFKGVDAIREVPSTHWNAADYLNSDPKKPDHVYTARGGFLDPVDFDALEFGVSPNNLEATDASQLLALAAVQQALADAGYGPGGRTFDRNRTSVLLGVTGTLQLVIPLGARLGHPIWRKALSDAGVEAEVADDVVARISDAYVPWQENSFPGLLGNVVAGRIANRFDFGGSNCVVDAACASSLAAIHLAAMELDSGRADMVVSGGVDAFNDIFMYMCFSKTPALSPTGDAKPFDQASDGTILGEGLGIVLLKRRADAERDCDTIYAVLKGIGTSSDGRGNAIYAPTAKGQRECLLRAYSAAEVSPATIELIEAHGTGTRVGDGVEVSALSEVFSQSRREGRWCALGSVKSQIGHTKAAAGAAGLVKAAMALHRKVLPPSIKVSNPLEPLADGGSPFYVNAEPRPWLPSPDHPRRAGVSSFGFGGSNFHAVLEEHSPAKTDVDWDEDVQIVAFSAESRSALSAAVDAWSNSVSFEDWTQLRHSAASARRGFRNTDAFRVAAVLERSRNPEQLIAELRRIASSADDSQEHPAGVYAGVGANAGRLAFLFSGQGSQYVGMLRDLACRFPEMLATLAESDAENPRGEPDADRICDVVYPPTAFDDETRRLQERRLQATERTQPALGAMAAGLIAVLDRFDLRADVFAGHSYGELAALYAAKTYDAATLHRLSRLRGKAMADRASCEGAMLAVSASIEDVETFLRDSKSSLVVANRNAPNQFVLSGAADEIEAAHHTLAARNVRTHRLNVSAAFHSPLVAAAAGEFARELSKSSFSRPSKPVYANSTARMYGDADEGRILLANQLANPVEFVGLVRNMHSDGVRTFVEVGPSSKLVGLVRSILVGDAHQTAAVDASSGKRSGMADLARVLAKCAALGHGVDLAKWDPDPPPPKPTKSKSTVSLLGINYVAPKPPRPPRIVKARQGSGDSPPMIESAKPMIPNATATSAPPSNAARVPLMTMETKPPQPSVNNDLLREGILALQRSQQQTAELHRQFLEHQTIAQQSLLALLGQAPSTAAPFPAQPPAMFAPQLEKLKVPIRKAPAAAASMDPLPAAKAAELPKSVASFIATAAASPAVAGTDVGELLLEVVAEKTGYPRDMLSLDMGLDADLGIDSIKRVEILSAVQERSAGLKKVAADELGALRTLRDVVGVMSTSPPTRHSAPSSESSPRPAEILLEVVAEKTGYPLETLGLEMGLDADLGIDSIKRVEILSAVQDRIPGARKIAADELGALRTLSDVAAALQPSVNGTPRQTAEASRIVVARESLPIAGSNVGELLLKIVADKTGYPVEMLHLDMGLDADLGIDSIKRVEILSSLQEAAPELPKVGSEQLGAIRTLGDIVSLLAVSESGPKSSTSIEQPKASVFKVDPASSFLDIYAPSARPVVSENRRRISLSFNDVVWIVGPPTGRRDGLADAFRRRRLHAFELSAEEALVRDDADRVSGLFFATTSEEPFDGPEQCLKVLQLCAGGLCRAGAKGHAVLGALVELDGAFGFETDGISSTVSPRHAAVLGLVKTARFEWPAVACKAIDAAADVDVDDLAEEFLTEGPIEVGMRLGRRTEPELKSWSPSGNGVQSLNPGDLVVVSGGARGVTAVAACEFAKRFGATLAFLGRSELSDEPAWLRGVASEGDLKKALLANASDRPSPKQLNERCQAVLAHREIRRNLESVTKDGSQAVYRSADVRDPAQIRRVVDELRREFGPVRGLIHGAGVLADRLIVDKTSADYSAVYETKVIGAENLLNVVSGDDLRFLAFFSSSTARFGRTGQCDYAAANEVLNKIAQRERRRRPNCRVVSVNWGPWDGGMVDERLKVLFAEEGVEVIPTAAGASLLADLACGRVDDPVELVVLGHGSRTPASSSSVGTRLEPTGGSPDLAFVFDRVVETATHPVLRSHVIKGKAVVPAALMLEWMAHAAMLRNPGLLVLGAEDFQILSGIKLADSERATPSFWTGKASKTEDGFRVAVEMRCDRNGKSTVNARSVIVLANRLSAPSENPSIVVATGSSIAIDAAYGELLFHGPAMRAIAEVETLSDGTAAARLSAPPEPSEWFERPIRSRWLTAPLAIDGAFQLAILWSRSVLGAACLPTKVERFRTYSADFERNARVLGSFRRKSDNACVGEFEFVNDLGRVVARLSGCEFVVDPSLNKAFQLRECSAGS